MSEFYVSMLFSSILGIIIAIAFPYVKWGISIFFGKLRFKSNASLMMLRSRKNNFGLPYIFDNSKDSMKVKLGREVLTFPIKRDDKPACTLIGLPLFIRDIEDASHEIGLYYLNGDGEQTIVKTADFIGSEEMEIILNNQKLMSTVRTLLDNYKILFMIVIGLLIAVLFNVYVSWEMLSFINGLDLGVVA